MFGIVFSRQVEIPGVQILRADLTRFREVRRLFQEIGPSAVIHAAAAPDPNFCQLNRVESYRINVDASLNMADLCAEDSIPCVFTSSDLVFDGLNAPYREDDIVCPVSHYGEQKVLAEQGMLKRYPLVTICRMALMFGEAGPVAASFIQPMIGAMKEGRELKLFTNEFRTPLSGRAAVHGLFIALAKARGILHLGGPERISRYGFGRLLMDVLQLHEAKLTPCLQEDVRMAAPRPPDVSLDSSRASALGFKPGLLRNELEELTPLCQ